MSIQITVSLRNLRISNVVSQAPGTEQKITSYCQPDGDFYFTERYR